MQDVLLEVQGQKVSGYTQADVIGWLNHCSRNGNPVVLKTVPQGRQNVIFLNILFLVKAGSNWTPTSYM